MSQKQYKPNLERSNEKLRNFILDIEIYTDNWDDFCDCEQQNGSHQNNCMTMNFRKDMNEAMENQL